MLSVSMLTLWGNGAKKHRGKWKRGETYRNLIQGRKTFVFTKGLARHCSKEKKCDCVGSYGEARHRGGFQPAFYITISHLFARIIWKVSRKLAEGSSFSRNSTCLKKQQGGQ